MSWKAEEGKAVVGRPGLNRAGQGRAGQGRPGCGWQLRLESEAGRRKWPAQPVALLPVR